MALYDIHNCSEVGNGSRHTLKGVPEMMDTPPILNSYVLYLIICRMDSHPVFLLDSSCAESLKDVLYL